MISIVYQLGFENPLFFIFVASDLQIFVSCVIGANMYNTFSAPSQFQPQPQQPYAQTPFMMPQQPVTFPGMPAGYVDIISNPLVTNVMKEYGNKIMQSAGGQMMGQVGGLKYYFAVDTGYVMRKLKLVMFPFLHKVEFCCLLFHD